MTRAIILAGGYGTRMAPLTHRRPKHLLPLGDEPVIAHQLRWLAAAGITDVVLATAYQADAFRPVLGDGSCYGVQLHYVREDTPLGTGGALRHAFDVLADVEGTPPGSSREETSDDAVVVLNGDLVTEHDLRAHLEAHTRSGATATLHVRHVDDARPYGLVALAESTDVAADHTTAKITHFCEKPAVLQAGYINAGTYVVSPQALRDVPRGVVSSLERDVFPAIAERGDMHAYLQGAHFADIGTPQALLAANLRWAKLHDEDAVCLSTEVDPSADVRGSVIMPGTVIQADAVVHRSVVATGAVIGAGARLTDCVIADDARVAAGTRLAGETLVVSEVR